MTSTAGPRAVPSARRLVLVPGFGLSAASWRPVLAALPPGLGVGARVVELPGHGRRAGRERVLVGDGPWADSLTGELDRAGGSCVVVAFSFGTGVLARRVARAGTAGISACVLVGGLPGPETFSPEYLQIADDVRRGTAAADRRLVELYASTRAGRDVVARDLALVGPSARQAAAGLSPVEPAPLDVPTVAVFGAEDALVALPDEARVRQVAADAEVVTVPGAGHAVHLDSPAAVAAVVAGLLRPP